MGNYKYIKIARDKRKALLIEVLGGKCLRCKYDTCIRALDFHHIDPKQKDFSISQKWQSLDRCLQEIKKCILLCANCHRELHYGIWSIKHEIDINKYLQEIEVACDLTLKNYKCSLKHVKPCSVCQESFETTNKRKIYCSNSCRSKRAKQIKDKEYIARPNIRKVKDRPKLSQLLLEIEKQGYSAVGRKYGVTCNAIRKWVKAAERQGENYVSKN